MKKNILKLRPVSLFILISILQLFIISKAQSSSCNWAYGFGGSGSDWGINIKLDGQNNLLTSGTFSGSVDFDPSVGTQILNFINGCRFLQKLDVDGNLLWVKQFGDLGNCTSILGSLEVDAQNNIYISGYFDGNFDADPSAASYILNGGSGSHFIIKLNTNGNFIWAKSFLNVQPQSVKSDMTVDQDLNVLLTGKFNNTVDFDPGASVYNLTSNGNYDVFVLKLDSLGNFLWAKSFGGSFEDEGLVIATDSVGNVYTAGLFKGTVDFDPGAGVYNINANVPSSGGSHLYISKLDINGNFMWSKSWINPNAGNNSDFSQMLIHNNKLTVSGSLFVGTFTFSSGQTVIANSEDIFIFSIDLNGGFTWAKTIGGANNQTSTDMAVDSAGNYFLTGNFGGTTDFDASPAVQNLTPQGSNDIFILKLDEQGDYLYARSFGGNWSDFGWSIVAGIDNNVFLTGIFQDTVDFDPDGPIYNIISNGNYDGYVFNYHYFPSEITNTNVSCFGGNDGQATAIVTGNPNTYTYQWSNGQTTQTANNLFAGAYSVTVTDQQLCTISVSVLITQPTVLAGTVSSTINTQCSGVCNGSATMIANGGTSPYTYLWDVSANSQTTSTAGNICNGAYSVLVTDNNGCTITKNVTVNVASIVSSQIALTNLAAVDLVNVSPSFAAYYLYNLPTTINPPASNPRNFVDPGKRARFKVECRNTKSNGSSVVSGICKVRSNNPYISITDTSSALNNIAYNAYAWSADEFEIDIDPNTPPGTNAYIDFIVQETLIDYATTCIAIPITPLVYSPTTIGTIDDDSNPDSQGNNNDQCEPAEIIEFYPWLNNVSTLNAEYVRGRFENLDNHSFINIWNNVPGVGGTVYDATWWNYLFAQPQVINANSINTTPEFDFVFNYNATNVVNNFKLYMVMAGGFNLFQGNALSLVQWTLPYTFNNTTVSIDDEIENNKIFKIYPNPTTGNLQLVFDGLQVINVKVLNQLGMVLFQTENAVLDLSKFSKGIYYIQVQFMDRIITKKVVLE